MSHILSVQEVTILADEIARIGLEAHNCQLLEVAATATAAGCYPAAAGVLADPTAPPVARARAFATIARDWPNIVDLASAAFQRSFDAFLAQWNTHEQLRPTGDIARLWESKTTLAALRTAMLARQDTTERCLA